MINYNELILDYLDNQISDENFIKLKKWMNLNDANIRTFVHLTFVHDQIADEIQQNEIKKLIKISSNDAVDITSDDELSLRQLTLLLAENQNQDETGPIDITQAMHERMIKHRTVNSKNKFKKKNKYNTPEHRHFVISRGAATAAIVLFCAMIYIIASGINNQSSIITALPKETRKQIVANYVSGINDVWGRTEYRTSPMTAGILELKKGIAQIKLISGVDLTLQAPCKIELYENNKIFLYSGRVVALVKDEKSQGFTIMRPKADIVDYGTEFGVEATDDGKTAVTCFQGRIELKSIEKDIDFFEGKYQYTKELLAGDVAGVNEKGDLTEPVWASGDDYIRSDEMSARQALSTGQATLKQIELIKIRRLRRDKDLIAYAGFSRDDNEKEISWGFKQGDRPWRSPAGLSALVYENISYREMKSLGLALYSENGESAFLDLDLSVFGRFYQNNLINKNGSIGTEGTELWISFIIKNEHKSSETKEYSVVSLFNKGDLVGVNELISVGRTAENTNFSGRIYPDYTAPGHSKESIYLQPSGKFNKGIPIDNIPHRWVVHLKFNKGTDDIAIYFDPQEDISKSKPVIVNSRYQNLEFDRIRVKSSGYLNGMSFDELKIGKTYQSVTQINKK